MSEQSERPEKQNEAVDGIFPVDEHEEEVVEGGQTIRRKGIYVLPNLFTTGNLFVAFTPLSVRRRVTFPKLVLQSLLR